MYLISLIAFLSSFPQNDEPLQTPLKTNHQTVDIVYEFREMEEFLFDCQYRTPYDKLKVFLTLSGTNTKVTLS